MCRSDLTEKTSAFSECSFETVTTFPFAANTERAVVEYQINSFILHKGQPQTSAGLDSQTAERENSSVWKGGGFPVIDLKIVQLIKGSTLQDLIFEERKEFKLKGA